jgi:hypothetical protein
VRGAVARRFTMGPTSIIHAGEAGLTSVVEGMAKAREALPDSIREAADRKLGADSTLGKGVLAMVDTVAEESAKAKATKAALAVEAAASVAAADVAVAEEKAVALVEAAETAVKESRGRGGKILLGGLALGAAAGGAYLVWKRRQKAAVESLSGEGQWAPAGGGTVSDLSATMSSSVSEVAEQAPDAVSDAVDQASDAASDVVDQASDAASDVVDQVADSAADVADTASDAAADAGDSAKSFNAQIDEVADSMASDVVDAIETPEGGVKGV